MANLKTKKSLRKTKKTPTKKPHPVDAYVGSQIRRIRWLRNMTQQQLAKSAGVKFQQIQKYESGANRVSPSRLTLIAEALDTSIVELFGKYAGKGKKDDGDILTDRKTIKMVAVYSKLPSEIQESLYKLIMDMRRA